jgi:Tfp pilus assembly PilM family ATPase
MKLTINKREANVIQVALDHLYEMHADVLADAIRIGDKAQARESYHIQRVIEDLQEEIKHQLQHEENTKK